MVPATPVTIGGVDYVELVQPQASQLFQRIRQGRDLGNLGKEAPGTPLSPANIVVRVLDANSGGKAQAVASFLQRAGFVVLPVLPAPSDLTKSEILTRPRTGNAGQVVASYTSFNLPIIRDSTRTSGSDVTLVIGRDFRGLQS